MAEVHILTVGHGDCSIVKCNSGHVTVLDICGGNIEESSTRAKQTAEVKIAMKQNYGMCQYKTNPVDFLTNRMRVDSVFRFILSHPDMDHLDGFDNLMNSIKVWNFWDSGVRRDPPDFTKGAYKKDDWDRYVKVIDGSEDGVTVVTPRGGSKGKYWNEDDKGKGGDYVTVCAPGKELVQTANDNSISDTINNASYVIVYRSCGGRILLPGDAHDKTWEYVLANHGDLLEGCEFMLAPHHGRDSKRSWDFLDRIKPKFSVLGCAASKDLAYDAWNRRGLEKVTQNQAGHIAIYPTKVGLDIYLENEAFVRDHSGDTSKTDAYGNFYYKTVEKND